MHSVMLAAALVITCRGDRRHRRDSTHAIGMVVWGVAGSCDHGLRVGLGGRRQQQCVHEEDAEEESHSGRHLSCALRDRRRVLGVHDGNNSVARATHSNRSSPEP